MKDELNYELLADVAQVIMGQSPPSSTYNTVGEGLPFYQGKTDFGDIYPTPRVYCTEPSRIAEAGDILISVRAPVGPTNVSQERSCIGRGISAIRIGEKLDRDFLLYFLRFYEPELAKAGTGSTFSAIAREDLETIKIPLPPLTEQKRIASLLARADRLRQMRRTAHDLGDALFQSVFFEMFGDPLKHYQEKWKSVRFEEITTRITYGFTNPMSHLSSGIPIITGKNVLDGQIDFENVHYADQKEYDALTLKNKPNKGDILITKDGTIGRCAIVDVDFPICINQSVALIQLNEKVIPKYVFGYLYSSSVREFLDDMKKGVALQHLQITEFAQIPIPLPPLEVQKEFAGMVARVEGLRGRMSEAGRQVDGLFESLLAESFG